MACKRCGKCCSEFLIRQTVAAPDEVTKDNLKGLTFFINAHKDTWVMDTIDQGDGTYEMTILVRNNPCCHLVFDESGLAGCEIYETRPYICRKYACTRLEAIEQELKEKERMEKKRERLDKLASIATENV